MNASQPQGRFLMLVSDRADARRRDEVHEGRRPTPEYLLLEERHEVELLDWSKLGGWARGRSPGVSLAHVAAALRRLGAYDAVFSDGEHVGVPLAVATRALGRTTPHVMLGHHLTTRAKRSVFRLLRPQARISRVLVHSRRQLELVARQLRIPSERLEFVPYAADTGFWRPQPVVAEPLVVSAGREHRDYATLARACAELPVQVFVAAGSLHSPSARQEQPMAWPANFRTGFADHLALRSLYARARVVVVPLVPNDFQAGVTTILEAMAMGKAVVVSATDGQRDVVKDRVTGVVVPPGDPHALRDALRALLENRRERARLGDNARALVESRFSMTAYADRLANQLRAVASSAAATGAPV